MTEMFLQAGAGAGSPGPGVWQVLEHVAVLAATLASGAAVFVAIRKRETRRNGARENIR